MESRRDDKEAEAHYKRLQSNGDKPTKLCKYGNI